MEKGLSWMVDAEVVISEKVKSEKNKQIIHGSMNTANMMKSPQYLARLYPHKGSSKYLEASALFDTGANCNIIPLHLVKKLHKNFHHLDPKGFNFNSCYGENVKIIGQVQPMNQFNTEKLGEA